MLMLEGVKRPLGQDLSADIWWHEIVTNPFTVDRYLPVWIKVQVREFRDITDLLHVSRIAACPKDACDLRLRINIR